MSGHSKWSTIKRKKGSQDEKRGLIFGRLSKEISVAVREGGSAEPSANPRLRLSLQNARNANMPKDNIEKALKKGQGATGNTYHHPTYEGYGPEGVAVYVECVTDNLNRTVSQVRHLFQKYGGSLTTSGSLDFLFARKGFFVLDVPNIEKNEELTLVLIDAGIEQILDKGTDKSLLIFPFESFGAVQKKVEELSLPISEALLQRVPNSVKKLDESAAIRVQKLLDVLEEDSDVQQVFHNMAT